MCTDQTAVGGMVDTVWCVGPGFTSKYSVHTSMRSSGGVIESLDPLRDRPRPAAPRSVLLSAGAAPEPAPPGILSLYLAAILLTSIDAAIASRCNALGAIQRVRSTPRACHAASSASTRRHRRLRRGPRACPTVLHAAQPPAGQPRMVHGGSCRCRCRGAPAPATGAQLSVRRCGAGQPLGRGAARHPQWAACAAVRSAAYCPAIRLPRRRTAIAHAGSCARNRSRLMLLAPILQFEIDPSCPRAQPSEAPLLTPLRPVHPLETAVVPPAGVWL